MCTLDGAPPEEEQSFHSVLVFFSVGNFWGNQSWDQPLTGQVLTLTFFLSVFFFGVIY